MRRAVALLPALVVVACHDQEMFSMDGTWRRGGLGTDHSGFVVMRLEQQGDRVTGLLCRTESGHSIFRGQPVSGRYPRVEFEYYGRRFEGGIVADDQIHGFLPVRPDFQEEWFFTRTSSDDFDRCQSAAP